jgi:hypothetical protein
MKKLTNFNEFINEENTPYLQIYYGATYPYNFTIIKGDELYFVSFRKDKPFLWKYQGKINPKIYTPAGNLVKKPSMGLIANVQNKCKPPQKTNEEFEPVKDMPSVERLSFMNELKGNLEEYLKEKSDKFKVKYVPGKIITISTDRPEDIRIIIRIENDKIWFEARPTEGPTYEFNYNFDKNSIDTVFELAKLAIEKDPYQGIVPPPTGDTYKSDTDKPAEDIKEEDIEPLEVPITKKPKRRTRSININVIQDVLEDAYILDDIDLKDTSVEELVRRMLLETSRKSRAKKKK